VSVDVVDNTVGWCSSVGWMRRKSVNQSWISRVVQVIKSLQHPLKVETNLTEIEIMSVEM